MLAEAVLQTLKHAWVTLSSLHLPLAVMGGVAVSAWKHLRATQDVDLLIGTGVVDLEVVLSKLAEAKIRPKRQPPILTIGDVRIIQLLYEPPGTFLSLQIDLLLAESDYQRAALVR